MVSCCFTFHLRIQSNHSIVFPHGQNEDKREGDKRSEEQNTHKNNNNMSSANETYDATGDSTAVIPKIVGGNNPLDIVEDSGILLTGSDPHQVEQMRLTGLEIDDIDIAGVLHEMAADALRGGGNGDEDDDDEEGNDDGGMMRVDEENGDLVFGGDGSTRRTRRSRTNGDQSSRVMERGIFMDMGDDGDDEDNANNVFGEDGAAPRRENNNAGDGGSDEDDADTNDGVDDDAAAMGEQDDDGDDEGERMTDGSDSDNDAAVKKLKQDKTSAAAATATVKRKTQWKPAFPESTIKKLLAVVAPSPLSFTKDALKAVNRSLELILQDLADECAKAAKRRNIKQMSYDLIADVISHHDRFDFLIDVVPLPTSGKLVQLNANKVGASNSSNNKLAPAPAMASAAAKKPADDKKRAAAAPATGGRKKKQKPVGKMEVKDFFAPRIAFAGKKPAGAVGTTKQDAEVIE